VPLASMVGFASRRCLEATSSSAVRDSREGRRLYAWSVELQRLETGHRELNVGLIDSAPPGTGGSRRGRGRSPAIRVRLSKRLPLVADTEAIPSPGQFLSTRAGLAAAARSRSELLNRRNGASASRPGVGSRPRLTFRAIAPTAACGNWPGPGRARHEPPIIAAHGGQDEGPGTGRGAHYRQSLAGSNDGRVFSIGKTTPHSRVS
jgi:hypothetical protein